MSKYTKRPITIEALQYDNSNSVEIEKFVGKKLKKELESETAYIAGKAPPVFSLIIPTLEGDHKALVGDYIIKGIKDEFYPCKPDIFEASYDKGRHSHAGGHVFDEDKKKYVRRVEVKYMIRLLTYREIASSDNEGVPKQSVLISDFITDSKKMTPEQNTFATIKPILIKFDSEEEAANYIKDKLYHFVKTMMFEIVKVYN